ncbi:MAG: phytoene desaturase family protein [Mycobacteriales bacterium]
MSRVVVVGGGLGGLAAAARLAAGGHQVTVCEQAPVLGGKVGRHVVETSYGSFRFDTGPSLLTMPHVLEDLFHDTGAPLETVLDLVGLDPIAQVRFADGATVDTCGDHEVLCRRLGEALGGTAAQDWDDLWQRAGRIWAATSGPFLHAPVSAGSLAGQLVHVRDLATIAPWSTLRRLGLRYLRDLRLRMLLERYATYTGSDPRRAPAALAAVPYAELAFGGWQVRGGLGRIVDALAQRCRDLGADLRTQAEVTGIDRAGARPGAPVTGVTLAGGERLTADIVVANADATHLYADLVPVAREARRLRRSTPSLSGLVLLLGVRGRTPGLAQHTVLFPADYDAEFDAVFGNPARPPDDPTLYLSVDGDAESCPAGYERWFVLVNAPRQGSGAGAIDWTTPGRAEAYAQHLLGLLARRGLDVRDRLLFMHVRTPADLERDTRAVGGAIYGTSSNGARAAFLRPANRSPVPGLFLVGGSAHPGGGLPLVMLSAQIVAGLIGPA